MDFIFVVIQPSVMSLPTSWVEPIAVAAVPAFALLLEDPYGAVTQIRKGRFARPFSAVSWVTTLSNP